MRKLASLSLCLLLVFSVLAGAVPVTAAADSEVPDLNGRVYQAGTDIPASVSGTVSPTSGPSGTVFSVTLSGFFGYEQVGVWWNAPDGTVIRSANEGNKITDSHGRLAYATFSTAGDMPGIWSMVVYGVLSGHQAVLYYEITSANTTTPSPDAIPAPVNATISQTTGSSGSLFKTTFSGFKPGEPVGYWFNTPEGVAVEAVNQGVNWVNDDGAVDNFTGTSGMEPGLWSCVVQGIDSGHQAIVYFVVTPSGAAAAAPLDPTFPEPMPPHLTAGNGRAHTLK